METTTVLAYRQSSVASPSSLVIRLSAAEGSWSDRWPISGVNSWKSDKVGRIKWLLSSRYLPDFQPCGSKARMEGRRPGFHFQRCRPRRTSAQNSAALRMTGRDDRVIHPSKRRSSLPTTFFVKVTHDLSAQPSSAWPVLGVDRRKLLFVNSSCRASHSSAEIGRIRVL